jgi:LysM repeat protein
VYRLARLPGNPQNSRSYTVKRGETVSRIAKEHGVTPRSILVASGLLNASEVVPGRKLSIPGTFTIAFNDQPVDFDVQPRVEGGMAIAPFRQIFEHTGGVVHYQPTEREVHALSPDKEIQIKIGSREALVNSAVVLMDRAAFLDTGRTMVPVTFMTEALDLKAEYDLKTGAIYLIKK